MPESGVTSSTEHAGAEQARNPSPGLPDHPPTRLAAYSGYMRLSAKSPFGSGTRWRGSFQKFELTHVFDGHHVPMPVRRQWVVEQ